MTVQKTTMKRILLRHGGIGVGNPVYGNSQRQTRDCAMKQDCTQKRRSIYFQDDALVSVAFLAEVLENEAERVPLGDALKEFFTTQYLHIYILYPRPNIRSMHPHYFALSIFFSFRHATFVLFLAFFLHIRSQLFEIAQINSSDFHVPQSILILIQLIHLIFTSEGKRLFWPSFSSLDFVCSVQRFSLCSWSCKISQCLSQPEDICIFWTMGSEWMRMQLYGRKNSEKYVAFQYPLSNRIDHLAWWILWCDCWREGISDFWRWRGLRVMRVQNTYHFW